MKSVDKPEEEFESKLMFAYELATTDSERI
jgi:hypothetical protein